MKTISEIYGELVPHLIATADYMEKADTTNRDEAVKHVKEAYILISECVKYTGLNTTKHIWSHAEPKFREPDLYHIDEDDI